MSNRTCYEDFLCLEDSGMQKGLYIGSIVYLIGGIVLTSLNSSVNLLAIFFFCVNKKTKKSPICICLLFLACVNLLRSFEFILIFLGKTNLIDLDNNFHQSPITGLQPSVTGKFCEWINFLRVFSGHYGIYMLIIIQIHRYLSIRVINGFNLMLYNHALAVAMCLAIFFIFLITDEFFLYQGFYLNKIVYCPLTLMFTCVTNRNFKLLNSLQFDIFVYEHYHTFVYNILPMMILSLVNFATFLIIHERKSRAKQRLIIGSYSSKRWSTDNEAISFPRFARNDSRQPKYKYTTPLSDQRTKEIIRVRKDSIFFDPDDVTYGSIILSFVHCLLAIPNNLLNYMAEWDSDLMEKVYTLIQMSESSSGENSIGQKFPMVSNQLIGETDVDTQFLVNLMFMISGLLEMTNFSWFLFFQVNSCDSLKVQIKEFFRKDFRRHKRSTQVCLKCKPRLQRPEIKIYNPEEI